MTIRLTKFVANRLLDIFVDSHHADACVAVLRQQIDMGLARLAKIERLSGELAYLEASL